jgi:serine/threonine-protein kinase
MVTDFGIAVAGGEADKQGNGAGASSGIESRLTGTGITLGTAEYMSPEQAAAERGLDGRSDVYSLGCVLYELLAGKPPHQGATAMAVMAKRFTEPAPRVRRVRPTVPTHVEQAIVRALALDPTERFQSAAAFAEALSTPGRKESNERPPSVAVLPFLNISADPENEFFADGITEDVIAHLCRIRSLKVISRASVMPYKKREQSPRDIAATLDVASLLDGSVRRAGSRVRIVATLIDPEADRHLWAETYDRELTDIFAIQTDVALQIAAALEAKLSAEERSRIRKKPTDNLEAYQLYLQGRHCIVRWTQQGLDQGLKHLEAALALDPEYALAYATMAKAYTDIALGVAGSLPAEVAFRHAKTAVARALELDPNLAEAHASLGHLRYACDYDWVGAEQELKRAIELNPNSGEAYDFYGLMLSSLERYDEAIEMQRRAHELDPLAHRMDLVTTYLRSGRYEDALRGVTQVLEVEPDLPLAHLTLGWVRLLTGQSDEGIATLERGLALSPDNTLYLAQLGQAYGMLGRIDEARAVLRRLEELSGNRYVSPYHMAYVHTGLGDQERAIDWLEQAYQQRAGGIFGVKGSFLFTSLRRHPRFNALLKKMNLA